MTNEAKRYYDEHIYKYLALIIAQFTFISFSFIIAMTNIALPTIHDVFKSSVSFTAWIMITFAVSLIVVLPIAGRLPHYLGLKRVMVIGFALYTVGSILAAYSPSIEILIATQVLLGSGCALLMGNGSIIAFVFFPKHQRNYALSVGIIVAAMCNGIGFLFGSVLIQNYGWNSIYLFNVPIGLIAIFMTIAIIKDDKTSPPTHISQFDYLGALLLAIGIATLFLGLSHNMTHKALFFSIAFISLGLFGLKEYNTKHPLIDLHLFSSLGFSIGLFTRFLMSFIINFYLFVLPFFIQFALDISPIGTGKIMIIYSVGSLLAGISSGYFAHKFGVHFSSNIGFFLTILGLLFLIAIDSNQQKLPIQEYIIMSCIFFLGCGGGLFVPSNTNISFHSVHTSMIGTVSSFLWCIHFLGIAAGASLGSLMLSYQITSPLTNVANLSGEARNVLKQNLSALLSHSIEITLPIACLGALLCLFRSSKTTFHP